MQEQQVTLLVIAATGGHEAMAQILLHHGATAGAVDNDGRTALMDAAAGGHVTMAQLLLDHGVGQQTTTVAQH